MLQYNGGLSENAVAGEGLLQHKYKLRATSCYGKRIPQNGKLIYLRLQGTAVENEEVDTCCAMY